MDNEKFQLWRLILGLVHIDGQVSPEEQEWFSSKLKTLESNSILAFNSEQIEELKSILTAPLANFKEEFSKLKKPSDRAQVVNFVRRIGFLDNNFGEKERELLKELEAICLSGVSLKDIENHIEEMETKSYSESEIFKVDNESSTFEKAFSFLGRSWNPGDHKFPRD